MFGKIGMNYFRPRKNDFDILNCNFPYVFSLFNIGKAHDIVWDIIIYIFDDTFESVKTISEL